LRRRRRRRRRRSKRRRRRRWGRRRRRRRRPSHPVVFCRLVGFCRGGVLLLSFEGWIEEQPIS
jgi:hypothetical protein